MKNYTITKGHEIIFDTSENEDNPIVSSIKEKLMLKKGEIDSLNPKKWELSKKMLNPYEFIYTSSRKSKNICSIIPTSRSYFKLHEIIREFKLLKNNIYCTCIAEGPGGFINCLNNSNIILKLIYGITLISEDPSIPYWNQSILTNKKVHISLGKDKTGNIYKLENVKYFIDEIGENKSHLVTADGGFDYSTDYNSQEINSYKLLYSEIYIALNIQQIGGSFVLKVFDLFNYKTIQLLYILYISYSSINIVKPSTSRSSNSEKYVVCSNYTGDKSFDVIGTLLKYYDDCEKLFIKIPESFINNIVEYNDIFTGNQIKTIDSVIKNIDRIKINNLIASTEQIKLAKEWCIKYELPINKNFVR
jgi:23S rRNA U2552 (ribose-2'-O)-methylase RlmE/FtsJ